MNSRKKQDHIRLRPKRTNKTEKPSRVRGDSRRAVRIQIVALLLSGAALLAVALQLVNLMIFQHDELSRKALNQQTRSTSVTASRGTIYDRNGNILAASESTENVFLDPYELDYYEADMNLVCATLAQILDLDPEWIAQQASDTAMRYKVIARQQSIDVTDEIRAFISENKIVGIHMEPSTKRYYPYGTLAAQVIGFTNASGSGAEGLEAKYDAYLEGTAGKVITTKGNYETAMPYSYEKYYEATDGYNLVTTIDTTIQYYLEKYMLDAVEQYDVENGAFGLVMNAKTGGILAMATLGNYDPNNYLDITDENTLAELQELKNAYLAEDEDSEEYSVLKSEYDSALATARLAQWRNRCVSDAYETGSTFKIITLASALEQGTTSLSHTYYCAGAENIPGRTQTLHCWRHQGHGSEDIYKALQNSCNLAFAHIALDLTGENMLKYFQDFGLTEATGVDMSGESGGVFYANTDWLTDSATWGTSYLTSAAMGQTFKVTPLQLVRAISAVVNGGYLMQPYVVSEITDADGNIVSSQEPTVIRQVISQETSDLMRDIIQSVVDEGTGSNAQIAGYAIGGKTGTAEKVGVIDPDTGVQTEDKIVSFVGIAPMDDPEYVVLIALDTPSAATGYISGGGMAGPAVRGVLEEILPYLGVSRDYTDVDMSRVSVDMPDVEGMTLPEAKEALEEATLACRVVGDGDTVTGQIPGAGMDVPGTSEVILYMGEEAPTDLVTVPDFSNLSVSQANAAATNAGLYLLAEGTTKDGSLVFATDQDIDPGTQVVRGTTVTVEFTDRTPEE